ncbi:Bacteriophytochrome (light-regulated signal transduction histidine kinase) [Sphingomonas gellani]|uniref:Bacteriophytochrome (Light-regulated signal transduction histidine kinase) n=1 Tax=Sphingomonas gellani TaxID=1166340 RepID=A0A1H8DP26_9SPHN|nr:histidine kinase dimerization/phosphoacceptor domain -containing protein [Sphingomonas gellani]SEN08574.1 Bacteriophytochrome (light-regulated signal transduction histidine kinase) [Sphingomonas gellani]
MSGEFPNRPAPSVAAEAVPIATDITDCDREPIHIPGSVQPHGLLLIAERASLTVVAGAGKLEKAFGADWLGRSLDDLLGQDVAALLDGVAAGPGATITGEPVTTGETLWSVALHRSGDRILVELEPEQADRMPTGSMLAWLNNASAGFERAADLSALCGYAAAIFRQLTGFDRVMIYRFLDEDAGRVVGEDRDPALGTFMHHHFPASDIPRQARALYVRNRTRSIATIDYQPAPIRPASFADTDLSDVGIRSVSPIHLQYLRNMGVEASASISIVKDGLLWGLIACHHQTPRLLPRVLREASAVLASSLARQIRAKEESEAYRERLRLRTAEGDVVPKINLDGTLFQVVENAMPELREMLDGDGFAYVVGRRVTAFGVTPHEEEIVDLARWARGRGPDPFATRELAALLPEADAYRRQASGLLAIPLQEDKGCLLWFRAEQVEEVEWAGNPHKAVTAQPGAALALTPRASFDSWTQQVRGRSRSWTLEEVQAAHRLRRAFDESARTRAMRKLNGELQRTLADKDALIAQKDVLMKEVNHRVQNSLQLVSAFLSLEAKASGDAKVAEHLKEAQARLSAVALVHRRLYRDEQVQSVDLARYLDELLGDLKTSLGAPWARQMVLDLTPVLMPTDRAVNVGLILTELVINATKYAYSGAAGPVAVTLEQYRNRIRLIVADQGVGKSGDREGFGSRMMTAMVARLSGEIDYTDNQPGLRVILSAPIEDAPR